ncbi:Protein of unknown function [Gryllus bimaculatus]|nr:Protein of unknown function [Gryllus bimaculatus]
MVVCWLAGAAASEAVSGAGGGVYRPGGGVSPVKKFAQQMVCVGAQVQLLQKRLLAQAAVAIEREVEMLQ